MFFQPEEFQGVIHHDHDPDYNYDHNHLDEHHDHDHDNQVHRRSLRGEVHEEAHLAEAHS